MGNLLKSTQDHFRVSHILYRYGQNSFYLIEQYRAAQEEAMEDDWRIGMIGKFLEEQDAGDVVCVKQLMVEALYPNSSFSIIATPKESKEIGRIMKQFSDWEKVGPIRTKDYGVQKCWRKTGGEGTFGSDELPF